MSKIINCGLAELGCIITYTEYVRRCEARLRFLKDSEGFENEITALEQIIILLTNLMNSYCTD